MRFSGLHPKPQALGALLRPGRGVGSVIEGSWFYP